uniref:Dehydrogenase/reductase SDR family member 11 n=1 Tax=Lygus hesperus TaxID=30085 RepID=A0A0K8SX12_LYGHE
MFLKRLIGDSHRTPTPHYPLEDSLLNCSYCLSKSQFLINPAKGFSSLFELRKLNMDRWVGKIAVVTGASAGIGQGIAKLLAEEGMIVVAVARREDRLKELAASTRSKKGGKVVPCAADITKNDQLLKVIQQADALGGISVLVNNAGTAINTQVTDGEIDKWRTMFELNVFAMGGLIREALKSMKKTGIVGHIINISSISAYGVPDGTGKHVYNGTKHAVRLVTEGIRAELTAAKSKVKITMVSPGLVDTEIFGVGDWEVERMRALPILKPEDVALACVQVLSTPPHVLCTDYIIRPVGETIPA